VALEYAETSLLAGGVIGGAVAGGTAIATASAFSAVIIPHASSAAHAALTGASAAGPLAVVVVIAGIAAGMVIADAFEQYRQLADKAIQWLICTPKGKILQRA
jgi:hypothetical protein